MKSTGVVMTAKSPYLLVQTWDLTTASTVRAASKTVEFVVNVRVKETVLHKGRHLTTAKTMFAKQKGMSVNPSV
jgi:hypothetical protein